MVNRDNWKLVRAYLKYRLEVDQVTPETQRLEESRLRHLLEWADSKPFEVVASIRPSFPEYLRTARIEGKGSLSQVYVRHIIQSSHAFFRWLIIHKRGFASISRAWLATLKIPRMTIEPMEHEAVTLDEIRAIASAPVHSIRERRARAAAVFLYLSGIRVGAFVTLPLTAIDLDTLTIKQWPRLGVKTKFKKHATTFMLDIPDLLEVVKDWDKEIRSLGCKLWFASVNPDTGKIDPSIMEAGKHRNIRARKDLYDWLHRIGLPYHSPHKFRHGHAVYALKNAKDIPALKAVSQNLMHANLSVTDGIYGILSDFDVKNQISALGKDLGKSTNKKELISLLKELLKNYDSSL